jgi:hypothetical protein
MVTFEKPVLVPVRVLGFEDFVILARDENHFPNRRISPCHTEMAIVLMATATSTGGGAMPATSFHSHNPTNVNEPASVGAAILLTDGFICPPS